MCSTVTVHQRYTDRLKYAKTHHFQVFLRPLVSTLLAVALTLDLVATVVLDFTPCVQQPTCRVPIFVQNAV
jgi:hypothetical protein